MHANDPLLTAVLLHDRRVRYEVAALRWAMRTTDHGRRRSPRATRHASADGDTA